MCPKKSFLKVCWISKWPFSHFSIGISGTRKVSGNFVRKVRFWKFHAKFCRNRLYLDVQKTRKTAKKKDGSGNSGFSDFRRLFRNFPIYTDLIPFYCTLFAERVLWKNTENAQTFSEFDFETENFPWNFRVVFFFRRFFLFSEFPEFREIGPNSSKFTYTAPLLKWHITLRFSENPKTLGFPGTFPVTSSREKFQGKCRGMRHGKRIENLPEFRKGPVRSRVLRKIPDFQKLSERFPRIPWHTCPESSEGLRPCWKKISCGQFPVIFKCVPLINV
jgi:hypothetical protein